MNALEIVKQYLAANGCVGLASVDCGSCGCGIEDLWPCGGPLPECHAAKSRVLGPDEFVGDCGPGDPIYYADTQMPP